MSSSITSSINNTATPPKKASGIVNNPSPRHKTIEGKAKSKTWIPPSTREPANILKANLQKLQDELASAGKWTKEQQMTVKKHIQEARSFLNTCKTGAAQEITTLTEVRAQLETEYVETYTAVSKLISKNDEAWSSVIALGQKMEAQNAPGFCQSRNGMVPMYLDAVEIQTTFGQIFGEVASSTNGTFTSAPLKRIFRALEKTVMKPLNDPNLNRADNVCDVVRGMIVYDNFEDMVRGMTATTNHADVVVMRTKNRYSKPTSGGWQDLVMNLRFNSDGNEHVCEVQFVHKMLLTVREGLGGHKKYNKFRSAMELLEVHGVVNDVLLGTKAASEGETKISTSPGSSNATALVPSSTSTAAIKTWLEENTTMKVKTDLTAVLSAVGVTTVLELASLGEEKQLEVMKGLKKMNQKKWISSDVGGKLKKYLNETVMRACSTTTIKEWLDVLQLTGGAVDTWLEDYGLEDVSDLNDLEEDDKNNLILAAKDSGGERDEKRVTAALQVSFFFFFFFFFFCRVTTDFSQLVLRIMVLESFLWWSESSN